MGKLLLVSILSIISTLVLLRLLKRNQIKNKKPDNQEIKDKVKALTKTPEFKILADSKEFTNLLLTKEFFSLGFIFGRDFVLEQLGL